MISFTPLVALGTLVFTVINFLKYLSARDWSSALTQVIAWVAGVGAMLLFAHTGFAHGIMVNATPLDKLNWASLLFLGLMATSILSTFNEALKALDTSQTAAKPDLVTGRRYVTTISSEPIKGSAATFTAPAMAQPAPKRARPRRPTT